jgi:hypothetical protein
MNTVGGLADPDGGDVLGGEVGELVVGEAVDSGEVLGFVL